MSEDGDLQDGSARIELIDLQDEMERSFLEYALSVILSRALPDVRDGLKPVQRRILYGMYEQRLLPDRMYKKCARVVGDVMGRYHPHGDQAIYDALVRMAQDFSLRQPLIDGHGNFGSPDFGPAAMRYTECRLAPLAQVLLDGIDENTVDFVDNYDGEEKEPVVLPARFPNLLVNGAEGIGVAVSTSIPPHNMAEICDAVIHFIDNPDATVSDLLRIVRGPDFPTGGILMDASSLQKIYETGRGSVTLRARTAFEQGKKGGRWRIVVTELPYQAKASEILSKIKRLVDEKRLEGIAELRDETSREGIRLVIELKGDAEKEIVLNQLFKLTDLERRINVTMVAVVGKTPKLLNLREAIRYYVEHQVEVVERRTRHRLEKAKARKNIVEGLLIAVANIDAVIATIRASEDAEAARTALMRQFELNEEQAREVLEMPLRRLTKLDGQKLREENEQLAQTIAELEKILSDPGELRAVIKREIQEVKSKFSDPRRTEIREEKAEYNPEDLIADEEIVVTVTRNGYVKAVRATHYRPQARGGRGVSGGRITEDDIVEHVVRTTRHSYLLFFTDRGRVFRLRALELPLKDRTAKGDHLRNFLRLEPEDASRGLGAERVQAVIDTSLYETQRFLLFVTKNGVVKKTRVNLYDSAGRKGIIAIELEPGDQLVTALPTSGQDEVMLFTAKGRALRFNENDVRPSGRATRGVRGMKLGSGDYVVAAAVVEPTEEIVIVTSRGFGKRTGVKEFRTQKRGGQGVKAMRLVEGKGKVAAAVKAGESDEVLVIATDGKVIRVPCSEISKQGRVASGVRIMRLDVADEVAALALVESG